MIARETSHSPEAVDRYLLDFSRVYYATVLKFGLNNQRLLDRIQTQLERCKTKILEIERAEQQPGLEWSFGSALDSLPYMPNGTIYNLCCTFLYKTPINRVQHAKKSPFGQE